MVSTRAFGSDDILAIASIDYQAGRFVDVQRGCEAALKLAPENAGALYLLGLAEIQLDSVDAGLARMKAAIARDPARVDRVCGCAAVLARLQRHNEAVAILGRAVMRMPDNAETFRQLVATALASADCPVSGTGETAATVDNRSVSIVVCSIDAQKATRIRGHYQTLFNGRDVEIIQIADAVSLSEGYNRGFAKTSGDVVIFSHDDIEIVTPEFPDWLFRHLSSNDIVGVAGTSRLDGANWNSAGWPRVHGCVAHERQEGDGFYVHCFGPPPDAAVEALDGLFIAANRRVCEAIRFDAATFDGFHLYDLDFTYRAFMAGFRMAVAWDILIVHSSSGRLDAAWQQYAQKFAAKHRGEKIFKTAPPPVSWPVVQIADRARMIAFHRMMAAAQAIGSR